jgi:hypothetical protein
MNIEILHQDIKTFNDFLLTLNYIIKTTGLLCFKNSKDVNSLNSSNKQLLEYYKREKNKRIDSIDIYAKVYKIEFKEDSVTFGNEYNITLEEVKEIYFSNKENNFIIKDSNTKDLTTYFKEVENSIWIAFYNTKIEELKGGLKSNYDSVVFDKKESEEFFIYIVKNWLKEEVNSFTALQYVFTEMHYKNTEKETPYKITSTGSYFAREYWNKNYSNIYKFKNPKNPKLNKDNFTDYYDKRFKKHLTEFKGG